jgi:hypothetical protein
VPCIPEVVHDPATPSSPTRSSSTAAGTGEPVESSLSSTSPSSAAGAAASGFSAPSIAHNYGEDAALLAEVAPGACNLIGEGFDSSSRRIVEPLRVIAMDGKAVRLLQAMQPPLPLKGEKCWMCGQWRRVRAVL